MAFGQLVGAQGANPAEVPRAAFETDILQSERPVLAVLQARGVDDRTFTRCIAEVLRQRQEDIRLVRIRVEEYQDLISEWRQNKGYHAYNLDKLPAAALFRKGELVTTFNPTLTSPEPDVQRNQIKRQFERFLEKFIHYDPEKVTFNHGK